MAPSCLIPSRLRILIVPYLWMVLSAVAFALMSACGHAVREDFSWQTIALARAGLVLLFALVLTWISGTKLVFFRPKSLWLRSLAGSTSLLFSFYAITRIPVTDFLTITHMYPIWVALMSWPLLGERPGTDVWISIFTGLIGVQLISQAHFEEGNLASLAALASSFTSALSVIGMHRVKQVDARAIVVHFSAVALVFVAIAMLVAPDSPAPRAPDTAAWFKLVGVGLAATIGQVFMTKAFAAGSPSRVAIAGLTQVGFGMICDVIFFGKTFDGLRLLGIAMVMTPTIWLVITRNRNQKAKVQEEIHAAST